jgi:mannose-6-phosphate isomerase-like protein (cupin superfamily)
MNQSMYRRSMNYSDDDFRCPYCDNAPMMNVPDNTVMDLEDYGPYPFVINIEEATMQNDNFRTALWTGEHLQLTLMSIPVGGEIGLEIHPDIDQFLRIEEGEGIVLMGENRNNLDFQERVYDGFVFIVPAGTWHNLINTGNEPIKLYSIYAPPKHPHGTVHVTKEDSDEAAREY